jgi:hypothetical protein
VRTVARGERAVLEGRAVEIHLTEEAVAHHHGQTIERVRTRHTRHREMLAGTPCRHGSQRGCTDSRGDRTCCVGRT